MKRFTYILIYLLFVMTYVHVILYGRHTLKGVDKYKCHLYCSFTTITFCEVSFEALSWNETI